MLYQIVTFSPPEEAGTPMLYNGGQGTVIGIRKKHEKGGRWATSLYRHNLAE